MKKKINVLITGPLPPPAGGISIHIWRLKYLLEDEFILDFIDEASVVKQGYFHVKSFNVFTYLKKISKADVLFIHSGSRILKKIHIATAKLFGKKIIITLHGYGARRAMPFRAIDAAFFKMANRIILVNKDIFQKVPLKEAKCIVKHAFLPPVMAEEDALPDSVADSILQARNQKRILLCANASRLDLNNNQDLYGLDLCIEVTKRLIDHGLPVSFIYTVSSLDSGAERFNKAKEQIASYNLKEHFLLLNEKLSFVRLIESTDIVLRPTNTDGDALTVREAIYLNKPIIASDIVSRPEGTILFKNRNIDDLETTLQSVIKDDRYKTLNRQNTGTENFKLFYTDLINNVVA